MDESEKADLWVKRENLDSPDLEKESRDCYYIEGYIQASNLHAPTDSENSLLKRQRKGNDFPTTGNNVPGIPGREKAKENNLVLSGSKPSSPLSDVSWTNGPNAHDPLLPGDGADTTQTVISCHHLGYTVKVPPKGAKGPKAKCCRSEEKAILQDINGLFKPGLNAILGATGSGKTTLLDTLAGRKHPDGMTGHVLVNGTSQPKNFKCMAGYVVQEDQVMGTLTVRENIQFSANLRLGKDIPFKQKKELVDDVIQELGLDLCADTKVGNEFIRGISGGEKKRTNIGMELIISPHLLFLDEPTSGLDSNTANSVVRLLSRLSKRGRTVIFSIHQPRYSIYKRFDSLLLLARGRTVYHGPMSEALGYFTGLGYACESHNNPSDFFLDIINGDPEVIRLDSAPGSNNESQAKNSTDIAQVEAAEKEPLDGDCSDPYQELAELYSKSVWCDRVNSELATINKEYESSDKKKTVYGEYANSFPTQLKYMAMRTVTNVLRNPAAIMFQLMAMMVLATIGGVLYFNLGHEIPAAMQNRAGFFFFAVMNTAFPNMAAIELFIKERTFFIHEHSNGFYGTSAYFISRVFFDFIPMRLVPTLLYGCVTYFMVGLKFDIQAFLFYELILAVSSLTAAALSFCAGVSFGIYAVAHAVTALCLVMSTIFGGLLVNLDTVPSAIQWLKYLSFARYGWMALLINEMKDETFYAYNVTSGAHDIEVLAGNAYLDSLDIKYDTVWDKWQNVLALAILGLFFLIMAYIQLRRINKYK